MAELQTTYMGLQLKNPIVPSASPLSRNLDDIKGLEDAGASAIVMYSLFEEQISLETGDLSHLVSNGAMSLADATVYFPHRHEYPRDPDAYVEHIRKAKEAVGIPVIGSMDGTSVGGWLDYAKKIEENKNVSDLWHYYLGDRYAYGFLKQVGWNDVFPFVGKRQAVLPWLTEFLNNIYQRSYRVPWVYFSWNIVLSNWGR